MATKKKTGQAGGFDPPKDLNDHIFYGMTLDPEQKVFRDMIYDPKKEIVFCEARAGSGKTTIAVATAVLMVKMGVCDDIVYVMHPVGDAQGFLPGTISEKSAVWFEPLYQALIAANEEPHMVINDDTMENQKNGSGFITALTDTYLRGSNIGAGKKTLLIIDEAQNYDEESLRKVLTRACEGTKVIVIGNTVQCDLGKYRRSGFEKCMAHFMALQDERVGKCTLKTCHRSFIADVADQMWESPNALFGAEEKKEDKRKIAPHWCIVPPADEDWPTITAFPVKNDWTSRKEG